MSKKGSKTTLFWLETKKKVKKTSKNTSKTRKKHPKHRKPRKPGQNPEMSGFGRFRGKSDQKVTKLVHFMTPFYHREGRQNRLFPDRSPPMIQQ